MKKGIIIWMFALFLLVGTVQAVNINPGTVYNTSISNSSVTFAFIAFADTITVYDRAVVFENFSYTNGELQINYTTDVNWSTENANIDVNQMVRISSSSDTVKIFSSNLNQTHNATIVFDAARLAISNIAYDSHSGINQPDLDFTRTGDRVSMTLNGIEEGTNNRLTMTTQVCTQFERLMTPIIRLFAVLGLLAILLAVLGVHKGWEGINLSKIIWSFVILMVGIGLINVIANILAARCV